VLSVAEPKCRRRMSDHPFLLSKSPAISTETGLFVCTPDWRTSNTQSISLPPLRGPRSTPLLRAFRCVAAPSAADLRTISNALSALSEHTARDLSELGLVDVFQRPLRANTRSKKAGHLVRRLFKSMAYCSYFAPKAPYRAVHG
jgi:hypothetical protein